MSAAVLMLAFAVGVSPFDSPPIFRVDTEIVVGTETIKRATIFDGMYVIDFDPGQPFGTSRYIVYDFEAHRITSVEPANKQQSPIACSELQRMMDELMLGLTPAQLAGFGHEAEVEQTSEGRFQIGTESFRYESATQPECTPGAAVQYATFADWAAKVNVLERRGSPPFARIKLNQTLALRNEVPESIRLTRTAGGDVATIHRYSAQLTDEDRGRLRIAHEQTEQFPSVEWPVR